MLSVLVIWLSSLCPYVLCLIDYRYALYACECECEYVNTGIRYVQSTAHRTCRTKGALLKDQRGTPEAEAKQIDIQNRRTRYLPCFLLLVCCVRFFEAPPPLPKRVPRLLALLLGWPGGLSRCLPPGHTWHLALAADLSPTTHKAQARPSNPACLACT
jgi:hypothetical protein